MREQVTCAHGAARIDHGEGIFSRRHDENRAQGAFEYGVEGNVSAALSEGEVAEPPAHVDFFPDSPPPFDLLRRPATLRSEGREKGLDLAAQSRGTGGGLRSICLEPRSAN